MTETAPAPEPFLCDGCGSSDTDPMIHVGYAGWQKDERTFIKEPSFHFDCLPAEFRTDLDLPQNATTAAAIAAAESGVHGEELREFIAEQPDDNQVEPVQPGDAETQED